MSDEHSIIINTLHAPITGSEHHLTHNYLHPLHPTHKPIPITQSQTLLQSSSRQTSQNFSLYSNILTSHPFLHYLAGIPSLLATLISNPTLLTTVIGNPRILALIAGSPDLLGEIESNPALLRLIVQNPDLLNKGAIYANMASILGTNTPSLNLDTKLKNDLIKTQEFNDYKKTQQIIQDKKTNFTKQLLPANHKLNPTVIANAKALALTLKAIAKEIDVRLPTQSQINDNKTNIVRRGPSNTVNIKNNIQTNTNSHFDILFANPALLAMLASATTITNKGKLFSLKELGFEQETQSEIQASALNENDQEKGVGEITEAPSIKRIEPSIVDTYKYH